jgi:hypothetical protein
VKRALSSIAGLALVLLVCGCGLGAGHTPGAVQLTVTRDFGTSKLVRNGKPKASGQETIMSVLQRNYRVTTRYGGGFVESIDGLAGGEEAGHSVDWFYYVNGIEAEHGASATNVHKGDRIWWDRHDWSQTDTIPAVVGAFPEPFLDGLGGKRWPVRIECAQIAGTACKTVISRLRAIGVPAAVASFGNFGGSETLRVVVAPWVQIAADPNAATLAEGPAASGVYARFEQAGHRLAVLDQDGAVVRTLGAGAGLLAATRHGDDAPVWFVTGTDETGVAAAARALSQKDLNDRFAVAISGTQLLPVPGTP